MVNTERSKDSHKPTLVPVIAKDEVRNRAAGVVGRQTYRQSVSLAPVQPGHHRFLASRCCIGNCRLNIWRLHALRALRRDSDQRNLVGRLFGMPRGEYRRPNRPVHYLRSAI
jgi:hypothetical protein